jgi:hypothetical protein
MGLVALARRAEELRVLRRHNTVRGAVILDRAVSSCYAGDYQTLRRRTVLKRLSRATSAMYDGNNNTRRASIVHDGGGPRRSRRPCATMTRQTSRLVSFAHDEAVLADLDARA